MLPSDLPLASVVDIPDAFLIVPRTIDVRRGTFEGKLMIVLVLPRLERFVTLLTESWTRDSVKCALDLLTGRDFSDGK